MFRPPRGSVMTYPKLAMALAMVASLSVSAVSLPARAEIGPEVSEYVGILYYVDVFRKSSCAPYAPQGFHPKEDLNELGRLLSPDDREALKRYLNSQEFKEEKRHAPDIVGKSINAYLKAGRSEADAC